MASSILVMHSSHLRLHTDIPSNVRLAASKQQPFNGSIVYSKTAMRLHCSKSTMGVATTVRHDSTSSEDDDTSDEEDEDMVLSEDEKKAYARLETFVNLNLGSWTGTFTQYDGLGNALATIPVKVKANRYGKGPHVSLFQTISIRQAVSKTQISDQEHEEDSVRWVEYCIDEIDALLITNYHKVGYFETDKAYCLSHSTAQILDTVLRVGLLGEDDDEEEEYFPGIKLPCRKPALVNESCMYSHCGNTRIRAFHVVNPVGGLDTIGIFHEHKDPEEPGKEQFKPGEELSDRVDSVVGKWVGRSVARRSGLYGLTLANVGLETTTDKDEDNNLTQTILKSTDTEFGDMSLKLTGKVSGKVVTFSDGLQTTLLPAAMAITFPICVGDCVKKTTNFCLEFSWNYEPKKRRRLTRTYDSAGAVVSTTLTNEQLLL